MVRVSPALNDQAEKQTLVRGDLEAVPWGNGKSKRDDMAEVKRRKF